MANGQSLALANALLKNVYQNGTNEQINNDTPALGEIKSSADNITTVGGAGVRFSVHFGRNHGIGARLEGEKIPAAGQQTFAVANTGLKSLYGTIQVTGQLMNQAVKDYQSFVNAVDSEVTRIKTDLAKDQNRQVYGDGTGTLATVATSGTASATIVFNDTRYLSIGMRVDLLQGTTLSNPTPTVRNPTANTFLTITGINTTTGAVTFDQTVATFTSGDAIVRSDGTINNWKREWTGLSAIVSNTGVLHGIDPATWPDWASTVTTGVGTLTELKMNAVVQAIRSKGSKPTRVLTTPGCYNAYWSALQAMRRYTNKTDLDGGLGGLTFGTPYGDVPLLTDFDCPAGTMWFVNEKEIHINTNVGWEWIDEQGGMWQKVAGYDLFVAEMRNYSEITTTRRNAHGVLKGVTEV